MFRRRGLNSRTSDTESGPEQTILHESGPLNGVSGQAPINSADKTASAPLDDIGNNKTTSDDADDDPDSGTHDGFWDTFLEEAAIEAEAKGKNWAKQLDAVLVFTGLFAGVVSAFLIDIRSRLHDDEDPQLSAIIALLQSMSNNTSSHSTPEFRPQTSVLWTSALWFISLGVTLISALGGVLAKGWLGDFQLSNFPGKPAAKAINRWKRNRSAERWRLVSAITIVPLLIQLALGLFLAGFVIQAFGDHRTIGGVLFGLVVLGGFVYAIITLLQHFWPHCPFQTPLTTFFHLVRASKPKDNTKTRTKANFSIALFKSRLAALRDLAFKSSTVLDTKISIVLSKLTRSSDDQILCAAAAVLNEKLEGPKARHWYVCIEEQFTSIVEALLVRVNSYAREHETLSKRRSGLISPDTSRGPDAESSAVTIYTPADRGVTCLRVVLQLTQANIPGSDTVWDWIDKHNIVSKWRSSNILPASWRFLAFNIYIAALIKQNKDCDEADAVKLEWETVISQSSSDLDLLPLSHAITYQGLRGELKNLKRACALGLAMFVEVGVALSPERPIAETRAKDIAHVIWDEFVTMWKIAAVQLLNEDRYFFGNNFVMLHRHKLYVGVVQEAVPRAVERLNDLDSDMQELVLESLSNLQGEKAHQGDIISMVRTIIKQLSEYSWRDRQHAASTLAKLSAYDKFLQRTLQDEKAVPKLVSSLEDEDNDVRAAAIQALSEFSKQVFFQDTIKDAKAVSGIVTRFTDVYSNVREAAYKAIQAVLENIGPYRSEIESSISTFVRNLEDKDWATRQSTIRLLVELSKYATRQAVEGVIPGIVAKLKDEDEDVRSAAIQALLAFGAQDSFQDAILKAGGIADIVDLLKDKDKDKDVRSAAIQALSAFSAQKLFQDSIVKAGAIPNIFDMLKDEDEDVRSAANQALLKFGTQVFYRSEVQASYPMLVELLDSDNGNNMQQVILILSSNFTESGLFQGPKEADTALSTPIVQNIDAHKEIQSAIIDTSSASDTNGIFQEKIKAETFVFKILDKFTDSDMDIRLKAVRAVSALGKNRIFQEETATEKIISKLIGKLSDDNWNVRVAAVEALSDFSTSDAFQDLMMAEKVPSELIAKLSDSDDDVCVATVRAISAFGKNGVFQEEMKTEKVISKLIGKLGDDNWNVRVAAVEALSDFSRSDTFQDLMMVEKAVSELIARLSDSDDDVCVATVRAISALGKNGVFQEEMKTEKIISKLIVKLSHDNWNVRLEVVKALSEFGTSAAFQDMMTTEEVVSKLIDNLTDGDDDVRLATAKTLSVLGKDGAYQEAVKIEKVLSKLISKLSDDNYIVRSAAVEALSGFSTSVVFRDTMTIKKVISKLVSELNDGNGHVHVEEIRTVSVLGKYGMFQEAMKTEKVISKLTANLDNNSGDIREAVVEALSAFGTNATFQDMMMAEKAVSKLIAKLNDSDEDVRVVTVRTVSALGKIGIYQEAMKTEKIISKLIANLTDSDGGVRVAAVEALSAFGSSAAFQDMVSTEKVVSKVITKFSDDDSDIRRAAVEALSTFSTIAAFQDATKTEKVIPKLITKLSDGLWYVRQAAVEALSAFSVNVAFEEIIKNEKAVLKLVSRITDEDSDVSFAAANALSTIGPKGWSEDQAKELVIPMLMQGLQDLESQARAKLYPVLEMLSKRGNKDIFFDSIRIAINDILDKMKKNDRQYSGRSIAILAEIIGDNALQADLKSTVLEALGTPPKSTLDTIRDVIQSKLVYSKHILGQYEVVHTLSRLAEIKLYRAGMKSAIPGLIEAVSDNESDVRSAAVKAISALAKEDELKIRLKAVISILFKQLELSLQVPDDRRNVGFSEAACSLISQFCQDGIDFIPQLTRVLSKMDISVTDSLLKLIRIFLGNSNLTMNDRIALASSLRVVSPAQPAIEVQLCRLEIAAMLNDTAAVRRHARLAEEEKRAEERRTRETRALEKREEERREEVEAFDVILEKMHAAPNFATLEEHIEGMAGQGGRKARLEVEKHEDDMRAEERQHTAAIDVEEEMHTNEMRTQEVRLVEAKHVEEEDEYEQERRLEEQRYRAARRAEKDRYEKETRAEKQSDREKGRELWRRFGELKRKQKRENSKRDDKRRDEEEDTEDTGQDEEERHAEEMGAEEEAHKREMREEEERHKEEKDAEEETLMEEKSKEAMRVDGREMTAEEEQYKKKIGAEEAQYTKERHLEEEMYQKERLAEEEEYVEARNTEKQIYLEARRDPPTVKAPTLGEMLAALAPAPAETTGGELRPGEESARGKPVALDVPAEENPTTPTVVEDAGGVLGEPPEGGPESV